MANNPERRGLERWAVAITAKLSINGIIFDTNILNINLGGCFCEGYFPVQMGENVIISSIYNSNLNGLTATVVWVVDEPKLKGVGLKFQIQDDAVKFSLVQWFNSLRKG